jgi:hypothetical protein
MNPKIFGFTDSKIFLFNHNKMFIMDRETGQCTQTKLIEEKRSGFILDHQNNIIQVDSLCKKIFFLNADLDILIENIYRDDLEDVFITKENKMAFVDTEKSFVIYV